MNVRTRIGVSAGVVSILFSTLSLIVMPVFTGSIILAPLLGVVLGATALALGARRTAGVTFVFALVPACGFFVMENFSGYFRTGYVAFLPLVVAVAVAAWALISYSRSKAIGPTSAA
jgi:hypothetical protein